MNIAKMVVTGTFVGAVYLVGYVDGNRAGIKRGFKKGWDTGWDNCAGVVDVIFTELGKTIEKQSGGK